MTVNVTKTAKVAGNTITLGDLRDLVDATKDFGQGARVTVKQDSGDRFGPTIYTITVTA